MAREPSSDKRHSDRFYRFFASYVLLTVVLLTTMGIVTYWTFLDTLQESVETSNIASLTQVKDAMDTRIQEMNSLAVAISSNPNLTRFKVSDQGYSLVRTVDELHKYKSSNMFISDVALYYRNLDRDLIYASSGTYSADSFFHAIYQFQNWSKNEFLDTIHELSAPLMRPLEPVTLYNNLKMQYSVYLYPLPVYSQGNYGVVFFLIRDVDIEGMLTEIMRSYSGYTYVLNEDGIPIMTLSAGEVSANEADTMRDVLNVEPFMEGVSEVSYAGEDFSVVKLRSDHYGWTYATVMPTKQFMETVIVSRNIFFVALMILLIVGLSLSYVLSRKSEKAATRETESLLRRLKSHSRVIRERYIYSLLKGKPVGGGELGLEEEVDVRMHHPYYSVILFLIDDYKAYLREQTPQMRDIIELSLVNIIEELGLEAGRGFALEQVENKGIVVLVNLRGEHASAVHDMARKVLRFSKEYFGLTLTAGCGEIYNDVALISRSFLEAKSAVRYRFIKGKDQVIQYSDVEALSFGGYDASDAQKELVLGIRQGRGDQVISVIRKMVRQETSGHISIESVDLLCFDIANTMMKTLKEMNTPVHDLVSDSGYRFFSFDFETIEQWEQSIEDFSRKICERIRQQKESKNEELAAQLLQYTRTHYTDESIHLDRIAAEFGLSASYVTRFFKDHTGETLMKYIDKLRMDKSKQLLRETDLPVKEIIRRCGYLDTTNFIRKFKSIEAITPTQYRELVRKSKYGAER